MVKTIRGIEPLTYSIGAAEIAAIAETTARTIQSIKRHMFSPDSRKQAPRFSISEVAVMCDKTYNQIYTLIKRNPDLGIVGEKSGSRTTYSLEEARALVKITRPHVDHDLAITIAIANFKGGVTKTTTAATLAQGLSLRGLNCLVIDLDPQGSLTNLFGLLPGIDVSDEDTVIELYAGTQPSIEYAIKPTYWDGISIVPATPILHNAEFMLPARQSKGGGFEFWRVLDNGLDSVRSKFDVIIIDVPPSLSYTTINGIMAADGLIMPLPPSSLDFASSAQFWDLTNDLLRNLTIGQNGAEKKFCFIDILLSKVDKTIGISSKVREWIVDAYGAKVLPIEIPRTAIADTAAAGFGTVYDTHTNPSIAKTLKRAKSAYDEFVDTMEKKIEGVWLATNQGVGK